MARSTSVGTRNARFQQWQALLGNRAKRTRAGVFLVQGVRPVTMAIEQRWPLATVLHAPRDQLSAWARGVLETTPAEQVRVAPELLHELGERDERSPEVLLVARAQPDELTRIDLGDRGLVLVVDRPQYPGNLGMLIRTADAFGLAGVVVTGHAADIYDPKTVRATTGSLFTIPVVRTASHAEVLAWVDSLAAAGVHPQLVGADEAGGTPVFEHDLRAATCLIIGNEKQGLTAGWRAACDALVSVPMAGLASSLNAATAGAIVVYEATRQRY